MNDAIVIEVTRGGRVESRHRGSVCVCDAAGRVVLARGDVDRAVFPRSAVKVFQAIPLVESGAAVAYGFGDRELSLACASHSGEAPHVQLAGDMLARASLDETALECGCHWPFDPAVARALARSGAEPGPLHNNCSGKHAGFLCTAAHLGEDISGYVRAEHPVQRRVHAAIEGVTGERLAEEQRGTDGCAIPTYAVPVRSLAAGFARLASGSGLEPLRAQAGARLIAACMAEPFLMAGTDRACVGLMQAAPGRVFVKTGAEGVFCGALPEHGLGLALKIEDGTTRAAEAAVAATLAAILRSVDHDLSARYEELSRRPLRNWNGDVVGDIRPTPF